MQIDILTKAPGNIPADLAVAFVFQGGRQLTGDAAAIDDALGGSLSRLAAEDGFEAKAGHSLVAPTFGGLKARKVALVGLGQRKAFRVDAMRRVGGALVKLASAAKAETLVCGLPEGLTPREAKHMAQALCEGLSLSGYRFHAYHGTQRKKDAPHKELAAVSICVQGAAMAASAKEGLLAARILSEATNYARDLVNMPPSDMTPQRMAEEALKLAGPRVTVELLDKEKMEELGMGAALAVARGSMHPPMGAHLAYKPRGAKKRVAIVGKAVTFDSGGLSLKPADKMMTMKLDMAGAAAVLGLFKALAELKVPIEVHGVFLAVENMPGGSAYRPGDVVTAMDGTTIEVLNTDAEGRVTLADALTYARGFSPDLLIDLATLTGACIVALGEDVAGLLSNDRRLAARLIAASEETGEPLWELPLYEPYAEMVRSKIADLKNIGGGAGGGTITAAFFLKPFVGDVPWAHLDIAGPSFVERETRADQPYGASGYGVRLLARFLQKL